MKYFARTEKIAMRLSLLSILISSLILTMPWIGQCIEHANGVSLKVLTINLLFSEIKHRETRLEIIADFIAHKDVDLILLQEVVGGPLSGTPNSSVDLKEKLAARGCEYDLSYRLANGLPGILTVGNAILSRYKILWTVSKSLPFVTEEPFDCLGIPLRRNVMMSRIRIPHFGKINVYNTHLCAFCDPIEERLKQAEVLVKFIRDVEDFIFWDNNPVILGGDFNTDLNLCDQWPVYDLITGEGFTDTYAAAFPPCTPNRGPCEDVCCPGSSGCTYAVPGNPYAMNLFMGEPEEPKRIDYICVKDVHEIINSEVVFKGEVIDGVTYWVSDHSGVLTNSKLR